MRIGNYDFQPRLLPTIATLIMMVVTGSAGFWQLGRAGEKSKLQSQFEHKQNQSALKLADYLGGYEELRYRTLLVDGEFIADKQVYIDNRESDGKSGYHVIAPLKLSNSDNIVLINRGWTERGRDYPRVPVIRVPSGTIHIVGVGSIPSHRYIELSDQGVTGGVWQNLTFERASSELGISVVPIVVLQQKPEAEGLKPVMEKPDFKIDMHRGYAFQWFALTVTLMVIYVVVNAKRSTA